MDDLTETCRALPSSAASSASRNPCLVHIYPTGPGMGSRHALATSPVVIGRNTDCEICILDNSVSRRHVCIEYRGDEYYAVDLQSMNGTFVNNEQASNRKLEDGDYLRVGNCIYRFLSGGNVEADYHEEIYRLTIIDALTEIHNKRYLMEFLDRELVRAARYGGEEFAIAMPETDLEEARAAAERIRQLLEVHPFHYAERTYQVTISLGVTVTTGTDVANAAQLIKRADEKLYQAKREGRNRVVA